MGRPVQLTTLREAVRQRYDLGTFSSSTWETTTAINALLNTSLQSFYALLMECGWDEYFGTYSDLTTTANVDLTSLPTRCLRVHSLVWLRDTDDPVLLEPASTRDARMSGLVARDWNGFVPRWRLHGAGSIRWLPTPTGAYTVRCTFTQLPADLANDDDTFDAGPGWDEWVVNDVCAKLAMREDNGQATGFIGARNDAEARVRSQAPLRGEGGSLFLERRFDRDTLSAWDLRDIVTRLF